MEYHWLTIVLFPFLLIILLAYIRSMGRFWWWASTSNLIIYYLAVFLICTCAMGGNSEHIISWYNTVMLGTISLITGCLLASLKKGVSTYRLAYTFYNKPIDFMLSRRSLVLIWIILIFGTVIIVLYLKALQDNVFMNILKEGLSVNTKDIINIRKKAVYGSGFGSGGYMASGYVMQFRSFLLPMIMLIGLGHFFIPRGKKLYLLCIIILAGTVSTFVNGATGQRRALSAPFIICAYLFLVRYYCNRHQFHKKTQRQFRIILISSLTIGFVFFGILTFALGRQDYSKKIGSSSLNVAENLITRVFIVPAQKDIRSIEILREYPPSLGQNWLQDLLKILPNPIEHKITKGWSEVGTPNWLHVQHGGSKEGNTPLSLWGSLWFNFRLPGVLIGGFIVGYLFQCYDRWGFSRRKTVLSVVCWQFGAISLAFSSSLGQILLTGFAAAMILLWLNGLFERGLLFDLLPKHLSYGKSSAA